ncbi:RNA polymerase sigma factor [Micromonospora kangleipakensis]|uniref:RNA polymerase sigma factor n=1 Tax=Micromonospora kangleipakensis TaxID=1077942 RepID=UPI00102A78BA|nr:RNA polymerase sigma factor [Micromonospora kangleipakensis]
MPLADGIDDLAGSASLGDRAALDALLVAVRPEVLRLCARLLPNREDAEEACQDTLLALARGITGFEARSSFHTWLYRLAANRTRRRAATLRRGAAPRRSRSTTWTPQATAGCGKVPTGRCGADAVNESAGRAGRFVCDISSTGPAADPRSAGRGPPRRVRRRRPPSRRRGRRSSRRRSARRRSPPARRSA